MMPLRYVIRRQSQLPCLKLQFKRTSQYGMSPLKRYVLPSEHIGLANLRALGPDTSTHPPYAFCFLVMSHLVIFECQYHSSCG